MPPVYAIQLALIIAVAAVVIFRLGATRRRPGDRAARALLMALICVDVALALGMPAFYWPVYRALGDTPGLPQLVQHIAAMTTAFHLQIFTLHTAGAEDATPEREHRRRGWLVTAVCALVICYVHGPLRTGQAYLPVDGQHDPAVAAYVAVIQLYAGITFIDIFRQGWTYRGTQRRFLRLGLRLLAGSAAFGLLFSAHKLAYFVASAAGLRIPWDESGKSGIQQVFLAPALLFGALGLTIPRVGPRLARRSARRRAHRHLAPLVAALRANALTAHLIQPARPRGLEARLLHQVIVVRDCLLGPLRSRLDGRLYALAHERAIESGLGGEEARAVAEAACVKGALDPGRGAAAEPLSPQTLSYQADLDAEAAWLARVGRAFATSDLVTTAVLEHRERPRW